MLIEKHKNLKPFNSFGIDVFADEYVKITTLEELKSALKHYQHKTLFILGGGSNILLTQDVKLPILHLLIKGIRIAKESEERVWVVAMAGENWHDFVQYCIAKDFGGIENLSLIPGNVGTAPMQNIGAYGVELKDVFYSCTAIHVKTGQERVFSKDDCEFGYRSSVFKTQFKHQYVITEVCFELSKKSHRLNIAYGAIQEELATKGIKHPTIKTVSEAVIAIRECKLPNPKILGNAGSFFKNPVVDNASFEALKKSFPEIPGYQTDQNHTKVPAGWLIDNLGLKGYRKGDAGVHKKQALVLVNYGKATGHELLELSMYIQQEVLKNYGIPLEAEVNIY
ncbi:MAG: UDP-N-acetylmuramate dehydrogenase [Flavobacteriaceae bacterium]|nr:UDP-N-acetylmuramate dehydrogenase [Flavobacteriaceae bacterium]